MGTETEGTTGAKPIEKIFSKSFENLLTFCFNRARIDTENGKGRENGGRFMRSLKTE